MALDTLLSIDLFFIFRFESYKTKKMELTDIIESCTGLWSAEHEERVINVLKRGKTGQTLSREEYHILNSYTLVSIGGVHKVTKMNGKYMQAPREGGAAGAPHRGP